MRLLRSAGVIGAAAFAALTLTAGTALSATSPAGSVSADATSSAACRLGGTLITPTAVHTDSLGVKYYTYRALPGVVTKVPPSGLTAVRVTPALLADIGLESAASAKKPLTVAARQSLDRQAIALSSAKAPEFCLGSLSLREHLTAQPSASQASSAPKFDHTTSDNWGGYAVTESEFGEGLNSVEGAFQVGQGETTAPADYPSMEEATWVGLGGGIGEAVVDDVKTLGLIQAGVAMLTDPGSAGPSGYTSWYEDLGEECNVDTLECTYIGCTAANNNCAPVYNAGDSTRPGDAVLDRVYYASSSSACFLLVDYTHSSGSIPSTCVPSAVYDHTSAEWINENWLQESFYYNNPGTIGFNTQNISPSFGGESFQQAFTGTYEGVIMETDVYDQYGIPALGTYGVNTCPAGNVLSEGVNASGSSSQIDTSPVAGCDT